MEKNIKNKIRKKGNNMKIKKYYSMKILYMNI